MHGSGKFGLPGRWTIPLPLGKLSSMTSTARPVCLITGAATGIGAACARTFASHGWDIGVCSLDDDTRPAADAVAAECTALGARAEVRVWRGTITPSSTSTRG